MASLQARHSRKCTVGRAWTKPDELGDCTCTPTYYVVVREGKKTVPQRIGQNKQAAERALRKVGVQVDEGSFEAPKNMRFKTWGDQWLDGLRRPANTVSSYRYTITYATSVFGEKTVRQIGPEDVQRLLRVFDEKGLSSSTQRKHLRVLGVCLNSAIKKGYAVRNPIARLEPNEKPPHVDKEGAWFEDDELALLLPAMPDGTYRTLAYVALMTGLRQGELIALQWGDVDFDYGQMRVEKTFTDGALGPPKGRRNRSVHVSPEVTALLARWWTACGSPTDDKLVFPGETKTGYVNDQVLRKNVYKAMDRLEIPREGVTGEKRTFHSFRHSFAAKAISEGRTISWLSRQLGHSAESITERVYAHVPAMTQRREADAMEGVWAFVPGAAG